MLNNNLNSGFSKNLEQSFEKYRNSPEYKREVEQRMKTLEVFWIFPDFARALALDSVETWIKVSELLDAREIIIQENKNLSPKIELLQSSSNQKIIDITRTAANDRVYWGIKKSA